MGIICNKLKGYINSTNAENKNKHGIVLWELKQYGKAILFFEEAIKLYPNESRYWSNRSASHIMMGNYQEALTDARKSILINDKFCSGYKRLSRCYKYLDNLSYALSYIKTAHKLNPLDTSCVSEMNNIKILIQYDSNLTKLLNENKYQEAINIADKYLIKVPESKKYKLVKAECFIYLQNFHDSKNIIDLILTIMPQDEDVLYVKYLHYYYKDFISKTFTLLQKINRLIPDDPKISKIYKIGKRTVEIIKLVRKNVFKNQLNEAYVLLDEAISLDPKNYKTNKKLLHEKITIGAKCPKYSYNVIVDCNTYLTNFGYNLEVLKIRASEYMLIGEYEDALKDYERILKDENTTENKEMYKKAKKLYNEENKDIYAILKLDKNIKDISKIKKAYRALLLKYHSDKHNDAPMEIKVKLDSKVRRIIEAYSKLKQQLNL